MAKLRAVRQWALRVVDYHVGAEIRWCWLRRAVAPWLASLPSIDEGRPLTGEERGDTLRVLDAGSGNGEYAFRLARRYPQVTIHGVELDGDQVAACRARLRAEPLPNLTFAQGDLTRPLETSGYDLIYSVDVLEHIADDGAALGNLARALRPGGRLLIHTPLVPQRHWLRRFDLDRCVRADHVRPGYGEAALKAKVREAGLEPMAVRYTHGRWGTLAWELWMLARWRLLAKLLLWPLIKLLIALELVFPPAWGNCILLEARKPGAR